jgi:probable HAF family extracellular repeat protein
MVGTGAFGNVEAVSGDGSTVVGYSTVTNEAGYWTESGGWVDIGTMGGQSQACGASHDGSVIVGTAHDTEGYDHPFRWTESSGMVGLALLPADVGGRAFDTSADGSITVGCSHEMLSNTAVIWEGGGAPRRVYDILSDQGVDLSGWTYLANAVAISDDGTVVCGYGMTTAGHTEGWIAGLGVSESEIGDCDGSGELDMDDIACFVDALLGVDTEPPGGIDRSDMNDDDQTDGLDIQLFVDALLN